jgi:chemotaxis protein methyltransferase CheR
VSQALIPFGITPLADDEFALFRDLIAREAGIRLTDAKRALFVNRLARRLRDLGIPSFSAYYRRVMNDAAERTVMLDRITTNETHFFREPRHFEFLERVAVPRWIAEADAGRRQRAVRVWSCACSTGEEPFSIAMTLAAALPTWSVKIIASDLSTAVLEKASAATWSIERAAQIPQQFLSAYMMRGTRSQEGKMRADPRLRELVEFRKFNLIEGSYPFDAELDAVFCRNVFIYFDETTRRKVVERLAHALVPRGFLFLGHAEGASGASKLFRPVQPTIHERLP